MRLSLPANYDSAILTELKACDVGEIYGKLPRDSVGGGRPTYMSAPLGKRKLERYVADVRRAGMGFNYLLNASCLGNREWTRPFHRRFDRLLGWLEGMGVETVTVVSPYLLKIIKRHFPRFKVKVGIYAQVDTVKRARYWEDLGADGINLESFSINRHFEKLERIREAVRCDLILIANNFCLPNCPLQLQHQNGHSHASCPGGGFLVDYSILQCQYRRLTEPWNLIAAGWIRPEDIGQYESIGYSSFKLTERNMPSEDLLKRARAYSSRSFEGNFAELLFSWGFRKHAPGFSWFHLLRHLGLWNLSPFKLGLVRGLMRSEGFFHPRERSPVVIDSRAIPADFLERFKRGCNDVECDRCGYCAAVAKKAVRIEQDFLEDVLPRYRALEDELLSGGAWGLRPRVAPHV